MNSKINANPTKDFFISMLTRDIDLRAAILELIDNSIDGARKLRKDTTYEGLDIKINFNKDYFSIEDNCGGISLDIAQNYAFRFGRSNRSEEGQNYTGVFGIGMKRSLFRIGRYFEVFSKTRSESFSIKIDVDDWMKDEGTDWSFNFDTINTDENNKEEECGTKIIIKKINEEVSGNFDLLYFENNLRDYIEEHRTIAAENGLKIFLNDKLITFITDELIDSKYMRPYSNRFNIGDVKVNIIAGATCMGEPRKAGWYIYCNGRLIIYADRTELTGWGEDGVKQFHNSLAFFRGYVFFESKDLKELPWNTTKTGVDTSSQYYIAALTKMKEATKQIAELYKAINELDNEEQKEEAKNLIFNSQRISLTSSNIELVTNNVDNFEFKVPAEKELVKMSRISFKAEKEKVEILKEKMNVSTNKEVGEKLFKYYWLRESED